MPLFAYRCKSCGDQFEALIREEADTPKACPNCGTENPQRQLSKFATIQGQKQEPLSPCAQGQCGTGSCPYSNS